MSFGGTSLSVSHQAAISPSNELYSRHRKTDAVFRTSVPVAWFVAGSGRDEISDLAASIIERDGSLAASELAKAGGVSVRTAQRWIRRLAEGGKLKASARDPHRYVLRNADQDGEAT